LLIEPQERGGTRKAVPRKAAPPLAIQAMERVERHFAKHLLDSIFSLEKFALLYSIGFQKYLFHLFHCLETRINTRLWWNVSPFCAWSRCSSFRQLEKFAAHSRTHHRPTFPPHVPSQLAD
jgi:hypothetical protein